MTWRSGERRPQRPIHYAVLRRVATDEELARIYRFARAYLELPPPDRGDVGRVLYFGFRLLYGVWCADGNPGRPFSRREVDNVAQAQFVVDAWRTVMAFGKDELRNRRLEIERAVRMTAVAPKKSRHLRDVVLALGMIVKPVAAPFDVPSVAN